MARNSGIVIMAPPSDNTDGRKAMATMLSAIKAKQKVGGWLWGGDFAASSPATCLLPPRSTKPDDRR
jgi:hypothetical protein